MTLSPGFLAQSFNSSFYTSRKFRENILVTLQSFSIVFAFVVGICQFPLSHVDSLDKACRSNRINSPITKVSGNHRCTEFLIELNHNLGPNNMQEIIFFRNRDICS